MRVLFSVFFFWRSSDTTGFFVSIGILGHTHTHNDDMERSFDDDFSLFFYHDIELFLFFGGQTHLGVLSLARSLARWLGLEYGA